jgi:hypothetical protein
MRERQPGRAGSRLVRQIAGGASLLGAVLMLNGCGGGASTPTVASLGGQHAAQSPPSGRLTESQSDRDMVAFARCMRAHGVQMSDPFHRPGHSGLSIDFPPQSPATVVGYAACSGVIKPVIGSKAGAPAETAADLASLTRYAECIRGRDISMLDPTPQGSLNLGNVPGITDDFGRYSPQFRLADAACRHLLPAGVHDDGTGP